MSTTRRQPAQVMVQQGDSLSEHVGLYQQRKTPAQDSPGLGARQRDPASAGPSSGSVTRSHTDMSAMSDPYGQPPLGSRNPLELLKHRMRTNTTTLSRRATVEDGDLRAMGGGGDVAPTQPFAPPRRPPAASVPGAPRYGASFGGAAPGDVRRTSGGLSAASPSGRDDEKRSKQFKDTAARMMMAEPRLSSDSRERIAQPAAQDPRYADPRQQPR
jgi:hypothetical protein